MLRRMTRVEYNKIMDIRYDVEGLVLERYNVFVTTTKVASSEILASFDFDAVIVDEAAQATELETLMAFGDTTNAILVGDTMQNSPYNDCEVIGPESMFARLLEADYYNKFYLTEQFRLHPYLA